MASLLYPNHPLGQPTVGSRPAIERLTLKQLQQHHAAYYTPHNAVLTVAGPVDHQQVVAAAKKHFGQWQGDACAGAEAVDRLLRHRQAAALGA